MTSTTNPMRIYSKLTVVLLILTCCILFIPQDMTAQGGDASLYRADSRITRLTFSGSNRVAYPSISDDGSLVTFMEEMVDTSTVAGQTHVTRMIKVVAADGTPARVVFADSTLSAPAPHENGYYIVGTKPPLISGNGEKVIFSLSLTEPAEMKDHYVGVVNSDGTGFTAFDMRNDVLAAMDWKRAGFGSDTWERVANYAVSDDGRHIACAVKGHVGSVSLGNPSGLIVIETDGSGRRTLMAPDFEDGRWSWDGFPRKPLTGGGWAFALSGDGRTLLYGAQSSDDNSDYDLYVMEMAGGRSTRVTTFHDRLFSFADISDDGTRITFFYSGKKGSGIGTYVIGADGTGLRRLTSARGGRLDYDDVTGTGTNVMYTLSGGTFAMDVDSRSEILLFSRGTPGYVRSGVEMDVPAYPSFWAPNFVSNDGKTVLLTGVPVGKELAELYVLKVRDLKKRLLVCPRCGRNMEPSWIYCPHDGTKLE